MSKEGHSVGKSRINKAISHGTGKFSPSQFAKIGHDVVFETGALVFHPENIEIGDNVYIGHYAIIKGYYQNKLTIGEGSWIGQQCFFHGAGGLKIGRNVGIGPAVKIITSSHSLDEIDKPIMHSSVHFAPVIIEDDSDIGTGALIMPGIRIGKGAQVGAGAVVTSDVEDYAIVRGVPAKVVGMRE
jgi:acetyltransferase-like isoleucine patch superfamily enzyme